MATDHSFMGDNNNNWNFAFRKLYRFAKFFTNAPEFTDEALEKEIMTVQSEFMMKLNNEAWRRSAVDAACCLESHSYKKFTTGIYSLRQIERLQ